MNTFLGIVQVEYIFKSYFTDSMANEETSIHYVDHIKFIDSSHKTLLKNIAHGIYIL